MPVRLLRDGILSSEKVCALTWGAEVFYRRLMSVVDDFGRYYADPKLLRAALYPLQLDEGDNPECVSRADVERWLADCERLQLVCLYVASDGKRYLALHNFNQQMRATKSKFPEPPDDGNIREHPLAIDNGCEQKITDVHLGGGGGGDEDVVEVSALTVRDAPNEPEPVDNSGDRLGDDAEPGLLATWRELSGKDASAPTLAVLRALHREGCAVAHLRAAWAVARDPSRKPGTAPISVNYLAPIVRDAMAGRLATQRAARGESGATARAWMHDEQALDGKARELNLSARPGETYEDLRRRVAAKLEMTAATCG